MLSMRPQRTTALSLILTAMIACGALRAHAQAALLMEEPYGFFGMLNPTGHTAIYFSQICRETPVKVRRCRPGESGSVIARYSGIAGYDWVAMPLIPYLYSVDDLSSVPARVDRTTVHRLRNRYHEEHLGSLGEGVFEGNLVRGGWTQLVGAAFDRRIHVFRFATTQDQDDAVIERLNSHANRSRFNLVYNNCADFARMVLDIYFPQTFPRAFFPDAGMSTPTQIAYKLTRYSREHPDIHLAIFEIPQVPGYRRMSRRNKSVSASLMTPKYAVPIFVMNPWVFGVLFVDYVTRGRFPPLPEHALVLSPDELATLQFPTGGVHRTVTPVVQEPDPTATATVEPVLATPFIDTGLKEVVNINE